MLYGLYIAFSTPCVIASEAEFGVANPASCLARISGLLRFARNDAKRAYLYYIILNTPKSYTKCTYILLKMNIL
jgi:hypothetical protein